MCAVDPNKLTLHRKDLGMARQTHQKPEPAPRRPAPATQASSTVRTGPAAPEEPRPGTVAQRTRRSRSGASHRVDPPDPATDWTLTNEADLDDNMLRIHGSIYAGRPKNTNLAYSPKQAEFQAHC